MASTYREPNHPQNNRDFGTYGESFPPLPDRKFSSKWQTERPWLVFNEEKNVMTCTAILHALNFSKVIKSVTPS